MKAFRLLIITSFLAIELSSFCMEKSNTPTPPPLPQNATTLQPPRPEQPSTIQTYLDKYKFEIVTTAAAAAVATATIPLVAQMKLKNRSRGPTIK